MSQYHSEENSVEVNVALADIDERLTKIEKTLNRVAHRMSIEDLPEFEPATLEDVKSLIKMLYIRP